MRNFVIAGSTIFVLAGCAHVNSQATYFLEQEENRYQPTCYSDAGLRRESLSPVNNHYCRFYDLYVDQLERYVEENNHVRLRNWSLFGLATYVGSTVLLNTDGLSGSQATDLSEAALGATIIQSTSALHDATELRNLHHRSIRAAQCAMIELNSLAQLEDRVDQAKARQATLRINVAELRQVIHQIENAGDRSSEIDVQLPRSIEILSAGENELARVSDQLASFNSLRDRGIDHLYMRYADRILSGTQAPAINFGGILSTLQADQTNNTAFLQQDSPTSPEVNPNVNENSLVSGPYEVLVAKTNSVADDITFLQSTTPNIRRRETLLMLCENYFSPNFQMPSLPINDDANEQPPAQPQEN